MLRRIIMLCVAVCLDGQLLVSDATLVFSRCNGTHQPKCRIAQKSFKLARPARDLHGAGSGRGGHWLVMRFVAAVSQSRVLRCHGVVLQYYYAVRCGMCGWAATCQW
jgi:hypothetical protein